MIVRIVEGISRQTLLETTCDSVRHAGGVNNPSKVISGGRGGIGNNPLRKWMRMIIKVMLESCFSLTWIVSAIISHQPSVFLFVKYTLCLQVVALA